MADLLLELFSEEIPARMQAQAAKDLERLVVGALSDRGLLFEGAKAFAGLRRLTLAIAGLPAKQPDVSEELKGPKVDAPQAALDGFLRKTGLTKDQLKVEKTPKGDVYLAVIERAGRATAEVLAEILPECFAKLPWPKSMRWPQEPSHLVTLDGSYITTCEGDRITVESRTRWVRPLHGIVCTFDGEVVPFEFAGVTSGNTIWGHRFLSSGPIEVRRYDDYVEKLRKAHVILDAEQRKAIIFEAVKSAAFVHGLEMIPDEGLLDEVAGLAEWPVVLIGAIQDEFMDVPPEILQTSMRTHQKYFSLRHTSSFGASLRDAPQDDAFEKGRHPEAANKKARHAEVHAEGGPRSMANRFAFVSNMIADDGGKEIIAGNERVLRARLSDAKFFWGEDRKRTLESRVDDLKDIVFHAKLGTQYERVERIVALAGEIAAKIGADVEKAKRAALLCKADLTSGVVGEFPELQGVMGRYYALHDGEDAEVAEAVRDHYKPQGPSDAVPRSKVSIAVALADKLDQLIGFFAIGAKPTGSGDAYALRRAALGIIRAILLGDLRLALREEIVGGYFGFAQMWAGTYRFYRYPEGAPGKSAVVGLNQPHEFLTQPFFVAQGPPRKGMFELGPEDEDDTFINIDIPGIVEQWPSGLSIRDEVTVFLADRLKVALREKGTRHDLIDAVFSLGNEDDLVRLVARVEALQSFLKTDEGTNLLAGYKRAANILKAEEKKDKTTFDGEPDAGLLVLPEEKALAEALSSASKSIADYVAAEKFVEAMGVMAKLRAPVDAFFDKVTVNDKDAKLRENRLKLLARLRATLHQVADFSKIEG